MSDISIQIAEIQLLKHLIDNPANMELCEDTFFITEVATDIYDSLVALFNRSVSPTDSHILSELVKRDSSLDQKILSKIHDVHVEDEKNDFDFYYFRMKEEHHKSILSEKMLPDAIINFAKKGKVDTKVVDDLIDHLTDVRSLANGKGRLKSYSGREAIEKYEDHLEFLKNNPEVMSTGDWYMDEKGLQFNEGEITSVFSNSGSGKSTLVQFLLEGRMICQLPFAWYITEMSDTATMNRVASSTSETLTKVAFNPKEVDGEFHIDDAAVTHLKRMKRKYASSNKWRLVPCDEEPLTLDALEEDIPFQRRAMGLGKDEPFLMAIDLASMVPELSGDAREIEDGMNKLSFLAKKHHVHFLLVIQAKEKRGQNITIKTLGDCLKYRPVLEDIKNSSAFTERSRTILMSFRPMNIINKFEVLREDPLLDFVEDILYLTVLKTNHGREGAVLYYKFDGAKANLTPYPSFGGWASQFNSLNDDLEEDDAKPAV